MKNILVKDFTASNKENLQKLKARDEKVFDLTVSLLAELTVLEKRIAEEKLLPPKPAAKSSKPVAKKVAPKKVEPKKPTKVDLTIADDEFDF